MEGEGGILNFFKDQDTKDGILPYFSNLEEGFQSISLKLFPLTSLITLDFRLPLF